MLPNRPPVPSARALELCAVFAVAVAVALVWTWPLGGALADAVPIDPRFVAELGKPAYRGVWDLWWGSRVLLDGAAPFSSPAIFAPVGHELAFHDHAVLAGMLSAPLQLVGSVLAYNVVLLLSFAAGATATWALARRVGLGAPAAAFAAFAWSFSPYFLQGSLRHPALFCGPGAPLFALAWLTLLDGRHGSSGAWRRGAAAALVAGACIFASLGAALRLGALALALFVCAPSIERDRVRARRSGLFDANALAPLLVVLVFALWPSAAAFARAASDRAEAEATFAALDAAAHGAGSLERPQRYHPRLLDFATPPGLHPAFPGLGGGEPDPGAPWTETRADSAGLWPGLAVVLLAACALALEPRSRRWLLASLPLFVLCWDPGPEPEGWLSALYRRVPFVDELSDSPARFFPWAHLPLVVAAAIGLDACVRRIATAPVAVFAGALCVLELWVGPLALERVRVPGPVEAIAASEESGGGGVCVLPFAALPDERAMWQAVHERPTCVAPLTRLDAGRVFQWRLTHTDLYTFGFQLGGAQPDALAIDLAHAEMDHVLVALEQVRDPARYVDTLDRMSGWTRGPDSGAVRWWHRSSWTPERSAWDGAPPDE